MRLIVELVCMVDVFWVNLVESCQGFPIEVKKSPLSVLFNELLQSFKHLFVTIIVKIIQYLIVGIDFLKGFFIIKVSNI